MEKMIRIALFENCSLFSFGLKHILTKHHELEIPIVASSVQQLVKQLNSEPADVLLLDILHCDNGAIRLLRRVTRKFPDLPIILLTSMQFSDCFTEHVKMGVKGFVFDDESPDDLMNAIRRVKNGGNYLPKEMQRWLKELESSGKSEKLKADGKSTLTEREISILKLFCEGLTYKEIGRRLFISPRTVETHKKNILEKLRLKSTADMVKYAFHNRLIIAWIGVAIII